jgi:hypothetical protein
VACALTFGLKAPYVSLPVGFGLLFMTIIKDQMVANNVQVAISDISSVMWIGGASMLVGLILAVMFYSRPREYKDLPIMARMNMRTRRNECGLLEGSGRRSCCVRGPAVLQIPAHRRYVRPAGPAAHRQHQMEQDGPGRQ